MHESEHYEIFVRQIWKIFIPTYYLPSKYLILHWLTKDVIDRLPRQVNYDTVINSVDSEWAALFDKAREEITRSWATFTPGAKNSIYDIISNLNMWAIFDRNLMVITTDDKNFLRARWHESDILYKDKKNCDLNTLQYAGLDIENKRIHGDRQKILSGIENIIYMRGHFDVAMVHALNVQKTPFLVIAVGTLIAGRPPHRSGRAGFPHPAPTSGV